MAEYIKGAREFQQLLQKVEKVPAKAMTRVVKGAANVAKAKAKAEATVETGTMRKSIGIYAERRRVGKKVYQLAFSKKMNDKLVKISLNGKRSYYPASQEYGFKLRGGGRKPGKFFMKNAISNRRELLEMIVDGLAKSLREAGA